MKKILTPGFLMVSGMVLLAAAVRLLPHLPNFTPIAAMALFGGAYFGKKKLAFIVPLIALFLSDIVLGFHSAMWAVYAGFVITGIIGVFVGKKVSVLSVFLGAIASSVLFFLITNFAVWITTSFAYPQTFSGLMLCYEMALPFFRNEILGTLVYSGILFGVYEFAKSRNPKLEAI